jgi:single-strand DNA-binding protein
MYDKNSVNKVILIGRLGKDVEQKVTPSGSEVANFSVATNTEGKDKAGNITEQTEWHKVVVWGKATGYLSQYGQKGARVYVEGRLQTRKWTDKEGVDRYTTEIFANQVQLLDFKPADSKPSEQPAEPPTVDEDDLPF